MNILIFGITGMIGSAFFKIMSQSKDINVFGTVRLFDDKLFFDDILRINISVVKNVMDNKDLEILFQKIKPDFVFNCTGIIKQNKHNDDPLIAVPINSLFPHKLTKYCEYYNAKLIQISTDCIFSGLKGKYNEDDTPDALDLYGRTKIIEEVKNNKNVLTIRTSVIGHELQRKTSFLDWVVNSNNTIHGYTNALYSGLTVKELVDVTFNHIFTNNLYGVYHISSNYISKFKLIEIICDIYNINIKVIPNKGFKIDRTLDSQKFRSRTGYIAPDWKEMIQKYYQSYNI